MAFVGSILVYLVYAIGILVLEPNRMHAKITDKS